MARMDALTKFNKMVELFTKTDDGKFNPGEPEALAGFFRGLTEAGKAKIKGRVIEVYQDGKFAPGTRDRFARDLTQAGLTPQELSGQSGDTAASLLKMSKAMQLDRLTSLDTGETGGSEGFSKDVRKGDVARDAQASISTALGKYIKAVQSKHPDGAEIGDVQWRAIFREEGTNGRGKELMGYAVDLPIYADDHDVDQALYFNVKGVLVGDVYAGE